MPEVTSEILSFKGNHFYPAIFVDAPRGAPIGWVEILYSAAEQASTEYDHLHDRYARVSGIIDSIEQAEYACKAQESRAAAFAIAQLGFDVWRNEQHGWFCISRLLAVE